MGLHHKSFLSLALVFCAASAARADYLELNEEGFREVKKVQDAEAGKYGNKPIIQQHMDPRAAGRGTFGFVRGMIIVEHDDGGNLAYTGPGSNELNAEPEKYFKFRPYNWIRRNGDQINWTDFRFQWKWVAGVKHEVDTLDDICMLMSWRCQKTGTDPAQAAQNVKNGLSFFARHLDPNDQLKIGGGGGQSSNNQAHEGAVTRFLLYGPMGADERRWRVMETHQKRGPIGEYGAFDAAANKATWTPKGVKYTPMDPDFWEETPESVIGKLVEAMARCHKFPPSTPNQLSYNIPFANQIETSARYVAQFLSSDLAHVPVSNNDNSNRLRAFAFRARAALFGIIEGATPERVSARRNRVVVRGGPGQPGNIMARPEEAADIDAQLRYSAVDDDLKIDVFDMASAAIDVLLFMKGSNRYGMLEAYDDDRGQVVGSLLRLAAGSRMCSGVATLQVQDDVGLKALSRAAFLSESQNASGDKFRDEILETLANPTNKMRANAAREALVRARADGAQLYRVLQSLFEIALTSNAEQQQTFYESPPASGNYLPQSGSDPRRDDAIYVISRLRWRSDYAQGLVNSRIQRLRDRQSTGTGSVEEKRLLDTFDGDN